MDVREKIKEEAESLFDRKGRIVLELSTGSGKTKQALDLIDRDGGDWDIVVPTTVLIKNWEDEIIKFNLTHLKSRLRVFCYASLPKYMSHDRGINFCFDEVHNLTPKRLESVLLGIKSHNKIIGLSATVDEEKKQLLDELGVTRDSYIKFSTDDAVAAGIVTDYELWVYKIPLSDKVRELPRFKNPMSEKRAYGFLSTKVNEFKNKQDWKGMQFWALWRKQFVSGVMSKEKVAVELIKRLPKNKRALIFATNIEQSDRLCENSFHSKSSDDILDSFNDGEFNVLSSIGRLREGINTQADIIIKLGIDSKEKNMVQILGRSLRLDPKEPNKKAIAVVLISEDTQEEKWAEESFKSFKNKTVKRWKQ